MHYFIIICAKYVLFLVVLLWAAAWLLLPKAARFQFTIATIIAGITALILSRIAGKVYFDPRPFVSQHVAPLIPHAADNGFPSDHALLTMTLTAITYFFNKKMAAAMLVLTILVGAGRVLARVHSPLDIAGGWVFGIIGALVGLYVGRWVWSRYVQQRVEAKAARD